MCKANIVNTFMNILLAVVFSLLSSTGFSQDEYLARSWPNGNPMVVYYLSSETSEIQKEQVFYENGQLDYEGNYLDGVEHGFWTYYWENGSMKSQEFYELGLEEGTMFDFDVNGNKKVQYIYAKGVLISKTKIN